MHIDKYKVAEGGYADGDETYFATAREFLVESVLGWCGCGRPDDVLMFVRDVLRSILHRRKVIGWYGMEYFVYYVLEEKGLIEHGCGLPGWLTDKGQDLLDDLNEWAQQEGANNDT